MSVTIQNVISLLDNFTGEKNEDRVSKAERYSAISEVTADIKQMMKGDMSNMTYELSFIPGIYYYKVNNGTYNVLAAADVRVSENDRNNTWRDVPFFRSSASKIAEDVARKVYTPSYALDRYDGDMYVVVNHQPQGSKMNISDMSNLTGVTLDGDAANIEVDVNENIDGQSFKFDVDVSLSGGNSATVNVPVDLDLTTMNYVGSVVGNIYLSDASETTSISIKLQTDSLNYYLFTATSQFDKSSFTNGWNKVVVKWEDSTVVGTPDITDINALDVTINYGAGQTDMTARLDDFFIARPTKLKFHYLSYSVGTDASGNEIVEFSADDDVPYYSGQYDNLKFAVARMAASIIFQNLRLYDYAAAQLSEGEKKLKQIMNLIPSSHSVETKSFRPMGISFNRRRGHRK